MTARKPQAKAKAQAKPNVIEVFNPATDAKLGEVMSFTTDEAREAVERAKAAARRWEEVGLQRRIAVIRRFKDLLLERAEEVCELISRENGKTLQEAFQMEVFPIIDLASYFAARAPKILGKHTIPLHLLKHRKSYLHYRPRGVVLIISPWNFPFSIPMGEVVMALLAGNAVVLKPASLTPLIALKAREIFDAAGLDPDVFQVLPCPGRVGSEMIEMGVDYVNFTGSTGVGVQVSQLCGRHLIPCSMELGGKDPALVLPDADLDVVTGSLVWGAFANAGQVCASIERAYVHESVYDEVVARVVEKVERLTVGDPLRDETDMGPMTDPGQLAEVVAHVEDALAHGATALTGGSRPDGPGQFYPPTVLVDVDDDFRCIREETFGPTLPIMKYRDLEDAITRANDSEFGLDAYVYSRNRKQAEAVAERLEAGTVMINETLFTHAAPETPWGGVKMSGVGRVHSDQGLRDLCIPYHVNTETLPTAKWSPFWQPYSHQMYQTLLSAARMLNHSEVRTRAQGAWGTAKRVSQMLRAR